MNLPIIFLDIDGVLNSHQTSLPSGQARLDPVNIDFFNLIIEETQAEIVISSTWRYWYPVEELTRIFREAEIKGKIIDTTACQNSTEADHRGTEIYAWLKNNHPSSYSSDPGGFVILDDRSDMEPYLERLVLCKMDYGLTENLADQAIEILME